MTSSTTRISLLPALVPLALPFIVGACIIPVGGAVVGDLRVTWSFDGSQRCAEVGVENVTIQLIQKGQEGKDGAKAFGQTAECIAGSMVIPDIVAGSYVMTAVGTGEVAVFNNGEGVTLDVLANQLTDASAALALANGEVVSRIEFQYNFAGEAVCSAADVTNINTQVIDDNGVAIAGSNTECITGLAVVEGIRVGEHTLQVEAVDGDGNVRFVAEKALLGLQRGETLRLDPLTLTPALVDVTVNFDMGGQSCTAAGVDNVAVQILDDDRVIAAQNVPCIDGRATFTDMPVGAYTVTIEGIDGNGEVLFNKAGVTLTLDGVDDDEADDDILDDISVSLDALLATVTVPFTFPDGATCAQLGVQNVDIQIIDSDGNATGTNVACVAGDSGPLIVADGAATIRIDAIVGEDVTFAASTDVTIPRGENVLAPIELAPQRTTLIVSWDFSLVVDSNVLVAGVDEAIPTNSCIDADVDTVIVRVFRGTALELAQAVDCDDGRVEMPGIPLRGGAANSNIIRVELEGVREQEGDAPFALKRDDAADIVLTEARTFSDVTLQPALAFALIVWAGDCGNANSATVDLRILTGGINSGINLPCAQGSQKIALPPGASNSTVTIFLRGIDGQGVAQGAASEQIGPLAPIDGINTFRFSGPSRL